MTQRLMAIDTATIYFRAFHGVPSSVTAPDGTVINAVRGTLDAVATLIEQFEPNQVVAAWDDAWRPAWRVALVPEYKAHRVVAGTDSAEDVPEQLVPQIPLVREALSLLGIPVVGRQDQEADDVLGALSRTWTGETRVVSGDRDLFQLVDDPANVSVIYTGAGMKKLQHVTDGWLAEKYGLGPGQYLDFAALRGDTSDGLPGVAGIGDKTAAKLLTELGDLESIVTAAAGEHGSLTPRIRANLLASREYLDAVRQVIAVGRGLELDSVPTLAQPQWAAFDEFAALWGLGRPAARAKAAIESIRA
ncbi:MAG: 5'-3' exonuclease [Actinomycetales bacterium]|nr:5'-3' exonuclease [Actinomycetales bacterium]